MHKLNVGPTILSYLNDSEMWVEFYFQSVCFYLSALEYLIELKLRSYVYLKLEKNICENYIFLNDFLCG